MFLVAKVIQQAKAIQQAIRNVKNAKVATTETTQLTTTTIPITTTTTPTTTKTTPTTATKSTTTQRTTTATSATSMFEPAEFEVPAPVLVIVTREPDTSAASGCFNHCITRLPSRKIQ